jgi:hypothetical protein
MSCFAVTVEIVLGSEHMGTVVAETCNVKPSLETLTPVGAAM